MAKKKEDKKSTEKTEEVKEVVEVEESKTEEKAEAKSKETKDNETEKSEAVKEEKVEEDKEVQADENKTENIKNEKSEGESEKKSDETTEEKSEEKSDTVTPEKKSLKDKVLTKKEKTKKSDAKKEVPADENKDGYVSAREVVNSIDEDVKIVEKSEDEILANHVAEQLRENQDYFIFRIRKSVALWIAGLTVVLLWMIPLSSFLKSSFNLNSLFRKVKSSDQVASPTPSPTPEANKQNTDRIRIKIDKETEKVASISSLLKDNGYLQIDVLEAEVKEDGINVAVKKDSDELRDNLMLILKDEYSAGSSSSELTDDSDFSAVILIGK